MWVAYFRVIAPIVITRQFPIYVDNYTLQRSSQNRINNCAQLGAKSKIFFIFEQIRRT